MKEETAPTKATPAPPAQAPEPAPMSIGGPPTRPVKEAADGE